MFGNLCNTAPNGQSDAVVISPFHMPDSQENDQRASQMNVPAAGCPSADGYSVADNQLRGDELSPRNAAWEGPHVGQCETQYKEKATKKTTQKKTMEEIRPRANSQVSNEDPSKFGTHEEGKLFEVETVEKFAVEMDHEEMGYSSPRSAAKREALKSNKDIKEVAKVGNPKGPKTKAPYGEYEKYIAHPNDKVECYDAAVLNSTTKRDVFYKDHSGHGDIRPKSSKSPKNQFSNQVGAADSSPRRGVRETVDRIQEDYYRHKTPVDRQAVDGEYERLRSKHDKINNINLPEELYQKKACRAQKKNAIDKHANYKAGHGLKGHDTDSEGEAPEWARGVSVHEN